MIESIKKFVIRYFINAMSITQWSRIQVQSMNNAIIRRISSILSQIFVTDTAVIFDIAT